MSHTHIILTILVGLTASAVKAAVVIDFDEFFAGQILDQSSLLDRGVAFDQRLRVTDGTIPIDHTMPGYSSPNWAHNIDDLYGNLSGSFTLPVDYVSILAGDGGGDADFLVLRGFDANGNEVASSVLDSDEDVARVYEIAAPAIVRFEIANAFVPGSFHIDNLTFNQVPEPSTPLLLFLGCVLPVLLRRKRHETAATCSSQ